MECTIPYLSIVRFLAVFLLFILPGYGLAAWLHRAEKIGQPLRWALGLAWSTAVFGLISWPFLWYGRGFGEFLAVFYPTWILYGVVVAGLWLFARPGNHEVAAAVSRLWQEEPETCEDRKEPAFANRRRAYLLLTACLGVPVLAGCVWVWAEPWNGRLAVIFAAPVLWFLVFMAARRFRAACGTWLRFAPADDEPAPRLWTVAAVALIFVQALSAVVYDRPDTDDGFYLASVLDYQQAKVLNDQEPTHREGFPMRPIQRLQSWELWGAVVCRLTGLNAMVVFHSLLPGLLVLLAYAAYAALLGEFLPRRWVPLSLLGLSSYFLWGISDHLTAANHLLPRLGQGKSVLLHIAMPLTIWTLTRFAVRPDWQRWASLAACVVFGLAASLSAIFMGCVLVVCLAPALMQAVSQKRMRILAGAALAVLPLVVCGLVIRAAIQHDSEIRGMPFYLGSWLLFAYFCLRHGSCEVIWLLSLPLLAVFLGDRRRAAYLVVFPVVLGLTFANPFLYHPVSEKLTSYHAYYRLWWLFPVGAGLAALLALTVRFLARTLNFRGRLQVIASPLVLSFAGLACTCLLPGKYVWSARNCYIKSPLAVPHLAETLEKMPRDLKPLADFMARDRELAKVRILCDEMVACYLSPYGRNFRFVQTRPLYTLYYLSAAGRPREALERHLLSLVLLRGCLPSQLQKEDWFEVHRHGEDHPVVKLLESLPRFGATADLGQLLARYRVKYVVVEPGDHAAAWLPEQGYAAVCRRGAFCLWQWRPAYGRMVRSAKGPSSP